MQEQQEQQDQQEQQEQQQQECRMTGDRDGERALGRVVRSDKPIPVDRRRTVFI